MSDKYIAFFDLLGTKAIAKVDGDLYFDNIEKFQDAVGSCKEILKGTEYKIRAFSDCAYVECSDLEQLFKYLKRLRDKLFLDEIFFNAAVTNGTLDCGMSISNEGQLTDDTCFVCMSFKSHQTVNVYSMQTSFTGVGIFIDPKLLENIKNKGLESYVINSSYCIYEKEDNLYKKFESFYDLRYEDPNDILIKYLFMNYLKTITLNKKAARYYLAAICTCINQLSYEELIKDCFPIFLNSTELSKNKALFEDTLPIHLMMINRLYDSYKECFSDKIEEIIYEVEEHLNNIIKNSSLRDGFDDFHIYSDKIISTKNKYMLVDYISKSIVNGNSKNKS